MPLGHTEQPGERVANPESAVEKSAEKVAVSDATVANSEAAAFEPGSAPLAKITPVKMAVAANGMKLNSHGGELSEAEEEAVDIGFESLSVSNSFAVQLREDIHRNPATCEFEALLKGTESPEKVDAGEASIDLRPHMVGMIAELAQFKIRAGTRRLGLDPHERAEVLGEMPSTQMALVTGQVREIIAPLAAAHISRVLDQFNLADRGEIQNEMPGTQSAQSGVIDRIRAGAVDYLESQDPLKFPVSGSDRVDLGSVSFRKKVA